jgi:L-Ala-D/L-Glu epimerase
MTVRDALKLAESGAVEIFNVHDRECGGLSRAREIVSIANAAGIACVMGSRAEGHRPGGGAPPCGELADLSACFGLHCGPR